MADKISCPVIPQTELLKYKKAFPVIAKMENADAVLSSYIGAWQEKTGLSEYPDTKTLRDYIESQRPKEVKERNPLFEIDTTKLSVPAMEAVDLDFSILEKRDRVSLIARLIRNKIEHLCVQFNTEDRVDAINQYGPQKIFEDIQISFNNEIIRLKKVLDIDLKYVKPEEIDTVKNAQKIAQHRYDAYNKILQHFKALCAEASEQLIMSEGVYLEFNANNVKKVNAYETETEDGSNTLIDMNDNLSKEEDIKEGWQIKVRQVSSYDSLSQRIRDMISHIVDVNYDGTESVDDLGYKRYLDPNTVHAVLIDNLKTVIDPEDVYTILKGMVGQKPWVKQIIDTLEKDKYGIQFSQFYQNYYKYFTPYWVQRRILQPNGTYRYKNVPINELEHEQNTLDNWRANYESYKDLTGHAIYDKQGNILLDRVNDNVSKVDTLLAQIRNKKGDELMQIATSDEFIKEVYNLVADLGIETTPDIIQLAFEKPRTLGRLVLSNPVNDLVGALSDIYKGLAKKSKFEADYDLINDYKDTAKKISNIISAATSDAIESSVHELGKSYYSHVVPNHLSKLIKNLKMVHGDKQRFDKWMQDNYLQYQWFYKNGEYMSDWVERLHTDSEFRKAFNHKVLLHFDKIEYADWQDLDYTVILLNEYLSDPNGKYAWYHMPVMSDVDSAEFIRSIRYKDNYEEEILKQAARTVRQEYDRIMLCRERFNKRKNGEPIELTTWDITSKELGDESDNIGGGKFHFFPALNTLKVNGKEFLTGLEELVNSDSSTQEDIEAYIQSGLKTVFDQEFERTYRRWVEMGLLTENSNHSRCIHIPFVGPHNNNQKLIKKFNEAKELLTDTKLISEIDSLIELLKKDSYYNQNNAQALIDRVKAELPDTKRGRDLASELVIKNNARDMFREYFYNSKHATSQIYELTTTDIAYYGDITALQKRFKELHSPALQLNINATYKDIDGVTRQIGRTENSGIEPMENVAVIKDQIITSTVYDDIVKAIDTLYNEGKISKIDRDTIVSQFKEVNVTDGQAYRNIDSYRKIMIMSGEWNHDQERAYRHLKANDGSFDIKDFYVIWQTKKPFMYTQIEMDSGVKDANGNTIKVKVPIQHKNSEFLILAAVGLIKGQSQLSNTISKSPALTALDKWMTANGVDVVMFDSAVKVGNQGVININNILHDEKEIINTLNRYSGFDKGPVANPNVIHKIPYRDYGIQTATPEHIIDHVQLVGTQLRKLIHADMAGDTPININGVEKSKDEWISWYNRINTANIIESFKEVDEIFSNVERVEEILLQELKGNQRYGADYIKACTLVKDPVTGQKVFNLPLFEPVQSQRIQQLLNSVIKNRITKQKIKGGACIQVSCFGLTDDLKIVFNKETINEEGKKMGDKTSGIKYMECYMPAYAKAFYEPLMDKNGVLDVEKLPEGMRRAIGYRIPTENKYSMAPLRIKGFLPQQNGSAIMLPAEITTLSGSDFDVDKLYIMLPEFGRDYDRDKARADYREYRKNAKEEYSQAEEDFLEQLNNASLYDLDVNENEVKLAPKTFKKWWKSNKSKYLTGFHKIEFDPEKDIFEQSREARNNYLIDLMWGVLTNRDTMPQILNPGGFPTVVDTGKIYSILHTNTEKEIVKGLESIGKQVKGSVVETLFTLSSDELKDLSQGLGEKLDPLSPLTQVILQQRNMAGANDIGIYATHNSHHAIIQLTKLAFNNTHILNGKKLSALNGTKNELGQYISKNCAEFLASSVDNAKNPSLDLLNQNEFTINATMLLIRMGYTIQEAGMFMQQPIVVEMSRRYMRERALGGYVDADRIIGEVIDEYDKKAKAFPYFDYKTWDCSLYDMAKDIMLQKEAVDDPSQTNNGDLLYYYGRQKAIGFMFKDFYKGGEDLRTVMDATKQDTVAGAVGPTIADNLSKIFKITTLKRNMQRKDWTLSGADVIEQELVNYDASKSEMLDFFMRLELPYLEAFDQLGVAVSKRLFERYFPHYRQDLQDLIYRMTKFNKRGSLSAKTIKSIFSDYFAYALSEVGFFHGTAQRNAFINEFPNDFEEIVNSNPDIAEIPFIQMFIKVSKSKRNSIPTLKFRRVGQLTSSKKTKFMQEWENMLRMDNPKARELALNLFKYAYYRNGFEFGPNTFIHLASVTLKQAIPGYIEKLRTLTEQSGDLDIFLEQYIRNHLDNTQLVHPVKADRLEGMPIYTEEGNLKDSFAIDFGVENFPFDVYNALHVSKGSHYPYIAITAEGQTAYYAAYISMDKDDVVEYRKIERLGVPNEFLEYDANNPDIKSVIGVKDLNAWEAENTKRVDSGLTEVQIDYGSMPTDDSFEGYEGLIPAEAPKKVQPATQIPVRKVETHRGYWTREEVAKQTDKVFLFGDNTEDRTITHYVPSSTQAVIRGLPNAIGIDTKKNRRTNADSYFTDDDLDIFSIQVDVAIQQAISSGKTIVLPEDGIGTGKAQLKEKAPKLFEYLQQKLKNLPNEKDIREEYDEEDSYYQLIPDDDVPLAAYQEVYGEMPEGYSSSDGARLMDIPNTEEVRDADGQKACKN